MLSLYHVKSVDLISYLDGLLDLVLDLLEGIELRPLGSLGDEVLVVVVGVVVVAAVVLEVARLDRGHGLDEAVPVVGVRRQLLVVDVLEPRAVGVYGHAVVRVYRVLGLALELGPHRWGYGPQGHRRLGR